MGHLQLAGQALHFFFKLLDLSLLRCPGSRWTGYTFTQSSHSLFRKFSSPIGALMAIKLFTAQKGSELAVLAGFVFLR